MEIKKYVRLQDHTIIKTDSENHYISSEGWLCDVQLNGQFLGIVDTMSNYLLELALEGNAIETDEGELYKLKADKNNDLYYQYICDIGYEHSIENLYIKYYIVAKHIKWLYVKVGNDLKGYEAD
jgi:hypothetical protein